MSTFARELAILATCRVRQHHVSALATSTLNIIQRACWLPLAEDKRPTRATAIPGGGTHASDSPKQCGLAEMAALPLRLRPPPSVRSRRWLAERAECAPQPHKLEMWRSGGGSCCRRVQGRVSQMGSLRGTLTYHWYY
jgi:hypothetical protein